METKPRINFDLTREQIKNSLSNRLDCCDYHLTNEAISANILEMMKEKTSIYGGDDNTLPLNEKILIIYYSGIQRKSYRMKNMVRNLISGGEFNLDEFVDTLIDLCGYSILGLNSLRMEISDEKS